MEIKQIEIKNFRGIRKLKWIVNKKFNVLIGPGDSRKTTILDAIEFTLSPRWNITLADSDFYNCNISNEIETIISIAEFPKQLVDISKFFDFVRGWEPENGVVDNPEDGFTEVLSICFRVDKNLEPTWQVINELNPEGKFISAKDREKIGMVRLGSYYERDLTWSKGSALSKITENSSNATKAILKANRFARKKNW